ncbi:NAD-dependent dehydratase [Burkholderia sp. Nafp2/4-1b]|uniref:NAD-dependent epimerase/dehydratase family protein n=1 Tax=Burkholderia sp. Nafp2/4-1b TaxID=2116686 RepID=UPI000EF86EB0|nr:NAD-dependent epimerase/dehydratase family protein [Burkholderia sp. Nafp2/4-1b]RKU01387.1 NAD-dependent dehydratase [Burkholderia sp. Nafp2/4-1b]
MRIGVSGATGFVGRALVQTLCDAGYDVVALVRRHAGDLDARATECVMADDDFASVAAGQPALPPCSAFVHLAARVHVMHDDATDPLASYRAANVQGALNALDAACRAGVRRFVFVSSVKALGEHENGRPLREDDVPSPGDPYGISKHEAEVALREACAARGIELAVVRPPLVYGPGVRANFLGLMRAVARGVPLPLGAAHAQRSMVYLGNLVDALRFLATRENATDGVFHVTDGRDQSVADLVAGIAAALGRSPRLVPVPVAWLRVAGALTGRRAAIDRLTSPLRIDCAQLRALGWVPPFSVEQGLARTVAALAKGDGA